MNLSFSSAASQVKALIDIFGNTLVLFLDDRKNIYIVHVGAKLSLLNTASNKHESGINLLL